jgi:hypothetical protein
MDRTFADPKDSDGEFRQEGSVEGDRMSDGYAPRSCYDSLQSKGEQGGIEEHASCGVDGWMISRRVLAASSDVGSGDEEWRGGEEKGAWRGCDIGLCNDGEAILFQTELAMIPERHGEAASPAPGKAGLGNRQLPCPVTISFLLDAPARLNGEGYLILRRELDYSLPDQCARVYIAGRYAATWMTAG